MSLLSCPHGAPPPKAPDPVKPSTRVTSRRAPSEPTGGSATGSRPRPTGRAKPAAAPVRRAPVVRPGRTPQSAYRPYLLAVLGEAGILERDRVMDEVGERMRDELQHDDLTVGPSGDVRWRIAAGKERRALADAGLVGSAGPGLWELTPAGYATLAALRAAAEAVTEEAGAGEAAPGHTDEPDGPSPRP